MVTLTTKTRKRLVSLYEETVCNREIVISKRHLNEASDVFTDTALLELEEYLLDCSLKVIKDALSSNQLDFVPRQSILETKN